MDTTLTLPASLRPVVDEAVAAAVGGRWASRLWDRDTSLWTDDADVAAHIAARLGWLDAPWSFVDEVAELTAFAEQIEAEGFSDALICGTGGSAVTPEVLALVYPESDKGLKLHVLDSTDPAAVAALDERLDPARTLHVITTRSGGTIETLAFLAHHWDREVHRVGRFPLSKAGNSFVSITSRGGSLDVMPHSDNFRETFLDPSDVGSGYDALTYVGLVPAALLRLDLDPLLEDARIMADSTRSDADDNPALVLGAAMAALARAGHDKLTFVVEPDLAPLGAWLELLIAGSTGRAGTGIVPVDGEVLGTPAEYGNDRTFVRLGPANDTEWHQDVDSKLAALTAAGHPLIDVRLDDASWVAAEFFRWEFATAVAAIGLGINPFDPPGGADPGERTRQVLETAVEGRLPHADPAATQGVLRAWTQGGADSDLTTLLREHIGRVGDDGYLHVSAFVAPTPARTDALRAIQAALRDGTGKASTLGYGPRYQHATGQLHKGGRPRGCFIQLTSGHPADMPIPGRDETFGLLMDAQAQGEFEALGAHELPALRIDLGDDVDAGLLELDAALATALA